MSKVANLTSRQADAAVKRYLNTAGRRKPYTEAGLRRVPCRRCGKPSQHQWHLRPCALGTRSWYGLCREHDIDLNRIVIDFLAVPDGDKLISDYRKRSEP